ncbi:MAG: transcription initiation factor IIB, partial [Fervidicoccus fontis]
MSDESSENKINCQHTIADMERGELICLDTGEVISTIIDSGPEWRDFSSQAERSRSRAGTPLTFRMHDHGLTTYTSESDIKKLPFRKRRKFIELKRKNTAIRMSKNKRMVKALQILNDEARKLGLPQKVTETAAYYIKKVVEKGLGRGEMIRAYVAASLFMACRLMKVPRTFYSVIISVGADEEKVRYAQRKIVEIQGGKINAKVTKPKDYIPMITSKLGLS